MTSDAPLISCHHARLTHLLYEARASVQAAYSNLDRAYEALAGANVQLAKYRDLLSGEKAHLLCRASYVERKLSAADASSECV